MQEFDKQLFLIPSTLSDSNIHQVIPAYNLEVIQKLTHFVVEEERTARRFLISCGYKNDIHSIHFYILNEHNSYTDVPAIFSDSASASLGLISEAGLPAVADPGAMLVAEAHRLGIRVIPLAGPSSMFMALMASGLNGQRFAFNGYLPVKPDERATRIKFYEKRSEGENQSQIFIEAPYRNNQLTEALLANLKPTTRLCLAVRLTSEDEWIRTKTVMEWRKNPPPDIKKKPAVFIFLA
jgi:16S rRNA (cytidine1402-2'-O)-methyltransferase